jgi:hypothetical protein
MTVWANKHQFEYEKDMWVADEYGTICMVGDMFVNFDDVRYDIDKDLDEKVFEEWYWYNLEIAELGCDVNVNLQSYANGVRPYTEEQLEQIRKAAQRVTEAQYALEKLIQETKVNNG